MRRLSSRQHPLVAACRALARGRGDGERLLLDGLHLVVDARAAGVHVETLALTDRVLATLEGDRLARDLSAAATDVVAVSDAVMRAMSPVSNASGVVAIAVRPPSSIARVLERTPHLVVIAVDIQDPGNVGAILRSAEAGGATGAAFCGASADPFGWKALRGSMGSALRLPVAMVPRVADVVAAARGAGARVVATLPAGGPRPDQIDLRRPVAFLLGGEGQGLAPEVLAEADERTTIPMRQPVESLNVAVASALLVYEAARQRRG
jgi:TrmH family RNA methyltransferase